MKAHVGRWSEEAPEHTGVVVCGMGDTPLVSIVFAKLDERCLESWADWEVEC